MRAGSRGCCKMGWLVRSFAASVSLSSPQPSHHYTAPSARSSRSFTVTALPSGSRSCRRFTLGIACQLLPFVTHSCSPHSRSTASGSRSLRSLHPYAAQRALGSLGANVESREPRRGRQQATEDHHERSPKGAVSGGREPRVDRGHDGNSEGLVHEGFHPPPTTTRP